jgi:hypothetical protein
MKKNTLKKLNIPKVAVLATGLTAAITVAVMGSVPAQAVPSYASTCTGCHSAGGSVTAKPSSATPAAGAAYTVAIAITATAAGNSGYWIATSDASGAAGTSVTTGGPAAGTTFSAAMTAPTAAGTYYYKVWANKGSPPGAASSVLYSITVAAATAPPTTVPPVVTPPTSVPPVVTPPTSVPPVVTPPTSVPPVVTPPTSVPPVVTPPTSVPPVVTPPTSVPPVVTPPTTVPPVVTPPTTVPPVVTPAPASIAHIRSLSVRHGAVGTNVTVRGSGFGTPGSVKFGSNSAVATSWTGTSIVVTVPATSVTPSSRSGFRTAVWYRHGEDLSVTVTPKDCAASNSMRFAMDSLNKHGEHESELAARHHVR